MKNEGIAKLKIVLIMLGGFLLMTTSSVGIVYSYTTGSKPSVTILEGHHCTYEVSRLSDWFNCPSGFDTWSMCTQGESYGWFTEQHRATVDCGCTINGCASESQDCVTLNYLVQREPTNAYHGVLFMKQKHEICKECYQEVANDPIGENTITREILVDRNKCDMGCPTICDFMCPPHKCEITDISEVDGFKCVPDDGSTAKADGQFAIAAASSKSSDGQQKCDCEQKVSSGNYQWCPSNKEGGCCQKDLKCCSEKPNKYPDWAVCCKQNQVCDYSGFAGDFCNNDKCPPDKPQLCEAASFNICCKPEPEEVCGKHGPLNKVAYCEDPTCPTTEKPEDCGNGICCKENEECKTKKGVTFCSAKSCNPDTEEPCPAQDNAEDSEFVKCCKKDECQHDPKGVPYCAPD